MDVNLRSLIRKFNPATQAATKAAANFCLARTHYNVEIEHYLIKLLDMTDGDFAAIAKHAEIDRGQLATDLTRVLDRFKTGNGRSPAFSPDFFELMTQAWVIASIEFGSPQIRTGFTVLSLFSSDRLSRIVRETSREFQKLSPEDLKKNFRQIVRTSREEEPATTLQDGDAPQAATPTTGGKTPHLDQYTVNLTENARNGRIDPVLGRDFEIRQVVDILTRRRQNNPILVGEAGVGKTAVAEGFALRISQGDVPPILKNVTVRTLDLALLQAGAGVKGEFENRLKGLVEEVKASPTPIILFIDEAHTMIGAGGVAGQNDAANLLKPALARGELRTIAATTWSEYKKYFEKDAALARRFQVIKVDEPTEQQCDGMLRGVKATLEKHHGVVILDEAVTTAVRLSQRYISGRQLPDKAVSVLDTACARVALAQNATPAALEDAQRRIEIIEIELGILEREQATGVAHEERFSALQSEREAVKVQVADLQARVEQERAVIQKMIALRKKIEEISVPQAESVSTVPAMTGTGPVLVVPRPSVEPPPDLAGMRVELSNLGTELATLQGENPLVRPYVDGGTIAEVIAG